MPVSEYSKDTDRTADVQTHDQTPFSAFVGGRPELLKGLTDCGYVNASPIQVAALPVVIAGTGEKRKTQAFHLIRLTCFNVNFIF